MSRHCSRNIRTCWSQRWCQIIPVAFAGAGFPTIQRNKHADVPAFLGGRFKFSNQIDIKILPKLALCVRFIEKEGYADIICRAVVGALISRNNIVNAVPCWNCWTWLRSGLRLTNAECTLQQNEKRGDGCNHGTFFHDILFHLNYLP